MLPAQSAFDFASVKTQIAKHVVIHFGKFGHRAADCEFGFDRPLHVRHERYNSRDKEPRDNTRSPSSPFDTYAVDFVEGLS